jgi:hypothetical protein
VDRPPQQPDQVPLADPRQGLWAYVTSLVFLLGAVATLAFGYLAEGLYFIWASIAFSAASVLFWAIGMTRRATRG